MSQYISEQKIEDLEIKANDARELLVYNEFGYINSLVDHVLKVAENV